MAYLADLQREVEFIIFDWLGDEDQETGQAVLDLSQRLANDMFAPHYRLGDTHEPELVDGRVRVSQASKDAMAAYAELGLFGASFAPEIGGMDLSQLTVSASYLMFAAANLSTAAYIMLTAANARVIATFATPAQVEHFAGPQMEGRWFGTMCLSEPNAGSSLADITTRATPDGSDGLGERYRVFGQKMWISGGEQDISENIVHLVLAKAVDSDGKVGSGTAGISLFLVPRILPDGSPNDVVVAGLNHKLGYRGIPNCALNFGEGDLQPNGAAGAVGWRIGAEGEGLRQMFLMMNEARIGVSLGAAAVGYRAFRQSLTYARERVQGKPADSERGGGNVAIIDHPDVQRMLMQQKCYCEGALALTLYAAHLSERKEEGLLSLLTPIVKSWSSAWTLRANDLAIQIHGGYGYTRDFDVELLWRDNRLNPIHEGTNGIQAIDLLERKILRGDGVATVELGSRIAATAQRARQHQDMADLAESLLTGWNRIQTTVQFLRGVERRQRLFHASPFLDAMGHVVVAWLLLDQLLVNPKNDGIHMRAKKRACRWFFASELPSISGWIAAMAMPELDELTSGIEEF
ncbi:MAG: acyl-CoA dehydrogenase [Sphingomonadales bacterium]|nr:MAG: acyl-CoA dehydrogenase [Sphingomonadales bacterium]TNF03738.1 MAG: acyl-CoA dehydrogenase [Sphingomonadales bacterium]